MQARRAVETVRFVGRAYRTLHALNKKAITPRGAGMLLANDAASMGPLYVKMAQFISARRDALDPDLVEALSVVQDRLPSVSTPSPPVLPGYVFEPEPIGRASIADVFRGKNLANGAAVVVKKRREGVKELITTDLPLLAWVMGAAAAMGLPGAKNMAELIGESMSMVLSELDFQQEARAQMEFSELTKDLGWLVVPQVHVAAEDFMVSSYVPSHKLAEVVGPNAGLAERLMDLYMTMLDRGFVHADPHPGNIGILPGGTIVLYDFGAMLRVDPAVKSEVAQLLQASVTQDADGVVAALERMGVISVRSGQRTTVRRTVRKLISGGVEVHSELQNTPEFTDGEKRIVRFGQTFIYLARALTLVDGACRAVDPGFSYDFSKWVEMTGNMAGVMRNVIAVPSTMHTMQLDMEEFQMRIVEEIEAGKRGASRLALLAAAASCCYFFLM